MVHTGSNNINMTMSHSYPWVVPESLKYNRELTLIEDFILINWQDKKY